MSAAVIHVESYLNKTGGEALRERVGELLQSHPPSLTLDFSGTKLVNSIGVSFLLEIIEAAEREHTPIEFTGVSADIVDLLGLLGISGRIPVHGAASGASIKSDA